MNPAPLPHSVILRAYFEKNADVIWSDALVSHELL
jgi:hypothetical protein